jgi:hypothetical protein
MFCFKLAITSVYAVQQHLLVVEASYRLPTTTTTYTGGGSGGGADNSCVPSSPLQALASLRKHSDAYAKLCASPTELSFGNRC